LARPEKIRYDLALIFLSVSSGDTLARLKAARPLKILPHDAHLRRLSLLVRSNAARYVAGPQVMQSDPPTLIKGDRGFSNCRKPREGQLSACVSQNID
jgi:hypothetical protein